MCQGLVSRSWRALPIRFETMPNLLKHGEPARPSRCEPIDWSRRSWRIRSVTGAFQSGHCYRRSARRGAERWRITGLARTERCDTGRMGCRGRRANRRCRIPGARRRGSQHAWIRDQASRFMPCAHGRLFGAFTCKSQRSCIYRTGRRSGRSEEAGAGQCSPSGVG